jgi:hypothetical protein
MAAAGGEGIIMPRPRRRPCGARGRWPAFNPVGRRRALTADEPTTERPPCSTPRRRAPPQLDAKRILATSGAIAVHVAMLMMLMMPAQAPTPQAQEEIIVPIWNRRRNLPPHAAAADEKPKPQPSAAAAAGPGRGPHGSKPWTRRRAR